MQTLWQSILSPAEALILGTSFFLSSAGCVASCPLGISGTFPCRTTFRARQMAFLYVHGTLPRPRLALGLSRGRLPTDCSLLCCRGASGFVQLAQDTETGEMVAIKCAVTHCRPRGCSLRVPNVCLQLGKALECLRGWVSNGCPVPRMQIHGEGYAQQGGAPEGTHQPQRMRAAPKHRAAAGACAATSRWPRGCIGISADLTRALVARSVTALICVARC
jgi:hypothetical protein